MDFVRRKDEGFLDLGNELRRTDTGAGLGLYLVKASAALDGGSVWATSDGEGSGAEFHVTWRTGRRPKI